MLKARRHLELEELPHSLPASGLGETRGAQFSPPDVSLRKVKLLKFEMCSFSTSAPMAMSCIDIKASQEFSQFVCLNSKQKLEINLRPVIFKIFILFWFALVLFETGSDDIEKAGLELEREPKLASNSWQCSCF